MLVYGYMSALYHQYFPQFYTATINQWQPLLADNKHKGIIVESLNFLVNDNRIILNAFVIMNNHLHLIWRPLTGQTLSTIQASFMKYTAQQLKRCLLKDNPAQLDNFKANKYDREYQIWKRESLSIELRSSTVFDQKLNYIHYNPVKAGLCIYPEDYYYSSAKFYLNGGSSFGMLTHP